MESVDYNWQCGDWISYRPVKRCIMQHACDRTMQAVQMIEHDNDENTVQGLSLF